jgi:hypothetical protein
MNFGREQYSVYNIQTQNKIPMGTSAVVAVSN